MIHVEHDEKVKNAVKKDSSIALLYVPPSWWQLLAFRVMAKAKVENEIIGREKD